MLIGKARQDALKKLTALVLDLAKRHELVEEIHGEPFVKVGRRQRQELEGEEQSEDMEKSIEAFNKRVAEVKRCDRCSNQEAMQKARREYPDEYRAFQS
jgi:hypothetical protein